MFAIVDIAGFQEKVTKGQKLRVPTLHAGVGESVTFDSVLLLADGEKVAIGQPMVKSARVEVKVLTHGKGEKIRIVKFKKRKRYRRIRGHRQGYTEIEIVKVEG